MPKKGYKQSPETIAKRVAKNTGKKRTLETRQKMSESKKGRIVSEETRNKIRNANKGSKRSEETKQKMREARSKQIISEDTKKKMSEAKKGKHHSNEACERMKEAWKHRGPVSDETRAKMSAARIGKKKSPEHCKKLSAALKGEKSPNWQGGISFEPYCVLFNGDLKERVRNFYGRICVECGKTEEENGVRLSVHHVNFNKESCCNKDIPLFVALCHSCHAKTNKNREYWEQRYTNLINEKYGGRCYLPKVENNKTEQEA